MEKEAIILDINLKKIVISKQWHDWWIHFYLNSCKLDEIPYSLQATQKRLEDC